MAKTSQSAQKSTSNQTMKLPVLIETIFTLSKLTVVLVGIIVMIATFANGNPYWVAMVRSAVTVLSLGVLVYLISWLTTKGVIESAKRMLREAEDNESSSSSMDTSA